MSRALRGQSFVLAVCTSRLDSLLLVLRVVVEEEPAPAGQPDQVRVLGLERRVVGEDGADALKRIDDFGDRNRLRPCEIILVRDLEICQILLRRLRREEREERVDAVGGIVTREVAEEELGQRRTERAVVRVTGAILEAPCGEVVRYGPKWSVTRRHLGQGSRLTRVIGGIEPVASHETDSIRKDCASHRVSTADARTRAERHTVLSLKTGVQLEIVDVPIQLTRRLRDLLVGAPLLKVIELLESQELTELVHGACAPRASLLHGHDLDDAQDLGRAAGAVRAGHALGCVLEDSRKIVVHELAIWATVNAASLGVSDIP